MDFTSDWGIGTGVGVAGGVDSVIEKDDLGRPVVRASVLSGVIRERAEQVADMLDDSSTGPWHRFVTALFGNRRDYSPTDPWRPHRLITFTDACVIVSSLPEEPVHEVVSLSIDERTGTAKEDHLRFFERAAPCSLMAAIHFLGVDSRGRRLTWTEEARDAARFLLTTSGLLVQAIGSNRSDGDGACTVLIGEGDSPDSLSPRTLRRWCRTYLDEHSAPPAECASWSQGFAAPTVSAVPESGGADRGFVHAPVSIFLDSSLVSSDVPLSNEIRSLDFLRGTTILPWIHGLLRTRLPDDDRVTNAVVDGRLLVSDALPVYNGIQGLPMPFVLSSPKVTVKEDEGSHTAPRAVDFTNRLEADEPLEVHTPARDGYLFIDPQSVTGASDSSSAPKGTVGWTGAPALLGRQSTAHDPVTGTAASGLLFLVRALPGGLQLRTTVSIEKSLYDHLEEELGEQLSSVFTGGRRVSALMGARRYSGAFGRVTCHVGAFEPLSGVDKTAERILTREGELTLWFTSDVIVRSHTLGGASGIDDLLLAFRRHGIPLKRVPQRHDGRFVAGIRHRRVDSWSAHDRQPRPTRVAFTAGSVVKVRLDDALDASSRGEVLRALVALGATGVGELRAQGFGRFLVCPEVLRRPSFSVRRLEQSDFLSSPFSDKAGGSFEVDAASEASVGVSASCEEVEP